MGKKSYSSMENCMHDWKKDHPTGKGKNVKDPQKQAVAVCLSKTNEGMSFKEYLYEMTYGDASAPHYEALQAAREYAMETGRNSLIVRAIDTKTGEQSYRAVPPGEQIPKGYDIWAEVNPRGKIHRVRGMY